MNLKSTIFLTVSFSCILHHTNADAPIPSPTGAPSLPPFTSISDICNTTRSPDLCAETIPIYLKGEFDPIKALEAVFLATKDKVESNIKLLDTLLADPNQKDKDLSRCYGICTEYYQHMLKKVPEILGYLANKDYFIRYSLSPMSADNTYCEDEFIQRDLQSKTPFYNETRKFSDLIGICFSISAALEKRAPLT